MSDAPLYPGSYTGSRASLPGSSGSRPRNVSLLTAAVVVAALFLARDFVLPLVLAILISFLLAPVIRRFEGWGLGRVASVIVATILAFAAIGGLGYVIAGQLVDLAYQLPNYRSNLRAKVTSFKVGDENPISRAADLFQELSAEFRAPPSVPGRNRAAGKASSTTTTTTTTTTPAPAHATTEPAPVPVEVVEGKSTAAALLKDFVTSLLAPLGTAAVVIVFVIFMLLEREDLRDRFIHLVGRGRLQLTTQAIDDTAQRVSRYLLAQFIVNFTYGIPIAIGLYFLGIPNAILWGLLAALLRYIPYVGAWIAASFPLLLSLAISPGWTVPLLAIALFITIELISNNVIEPWLYGSSTGLSPMAIIVSAVFWTWLWGGIGLLLATPLTVCLAVLGKYLPSLAFLDVLLGDQPPIALSDRLYQRLLALDEEEAVEIFEAAVQERTLGTAYDEILLPAIIMADADARSGVLKNDALHEIYALVRRLIAEVEEAPATAPGSIQVLCLPASGEADELVALMLGQLLVKRGLGVQVLSCKALVSEMLATAEECAAPVICISALPPASVMPATYMVKRLRARLGSSIQLVVGLWLVPENQFERRRQRLQRAQADEVFTLLEKTAAAISVLPGMPPTPAKATLTPL